MEEIWPYLDDKQKAPVRDGDDDRRPDWDAAPDDEVPFEIPRD